MEVQARGGSDGSLPRSHANEKRQREVLDLVPPPLPRTFSRPKEFRLGELSLPSLLFPTYGLRPELPVGGRLSHFLPYWKTLTDDPWILEVIAQGYALEFQDGPPRFNAVLNTPIRSGAGSVLLEEIGALCTKSAVETVPLIAQQEGFYSTYFTVPKKDGGIRPILNLKPFNCHLRKRPFKMETLQSIISIMRPGVWLASVDLKDAYFHVPITRRHWKYLRFKINGVVYQYKVTPFGLSLAPLLFTKVLLVIVVWLRLRGVHLHAYLDDILIVGNSPQAVLDSLRLTIQVLTCAGYILNVLKSDLTPSQDLVFIGGRFVTLRGMVFLPEDRRDAMIKVVRVFLRVGTLIKARQWLQLLGYMAATISTVALARLRMRPIQWHLKRGWKSASRDLEYPIMVTLALVPSISWWTDPSNLSTGMPYQQPPHSITVTTDASMEGWGGHTHIQEDLLFSGEWSQHERLTLHINVLELRAIRLTLLQITPLVRGLVVRIQCDNTTAIAYINKQGGTRSGKLNDEALLLYSWAIQHHVKLVAVHLPGVDNVLADYLSRNRADPTEWTLSKNVTQPLFSMWGRPQIDLFASHLNHRLPVWFSRTPADGATAVDAFAQSWAGFAVYAFPPANLLQRTLLKIRDEQVEEAIVIAPLWPGRPWFPLLLQMACTVPFRLRPRRDLLSQRLPTRGTLYHPNLKLTNLTAWKLNAKTGVGLALLPQLLPQL